MTEMLEPDSPTEGQNAGYQAEPESGLPASPAPTGPRWLRRPVAVAALLVGTVGASVGIGHTVWPGGASPRASASTPNYSYSGGSGTGSSGTGTGASSSGSSGATSNVSSIASKVDSALVDINVTIDGQVQGAGTGIVLTSDGEILTNNHVVDGATSISVTDIGNGKSYRATVVGYDATDDVAVLQLTDASGLETAKIANSSKVAVGDAVVAIGNAGGTGGTPTAAGGSITALNQAITASDELSGTSENLGGLIETNANIQSGDSGGALVNSSGQVVGMDTAAAEGYSLSAETNQGYAIPINKALSIASQIESGKASSTIHVGATAYIGVDVSTSSNAGGYPTFGSQDGSSNASGAAISGVVSGSPAAQAGLTQGDVITSLGGHSVSSATALASLMEQYKPGDKVQLGWTDTSGAAHVATITLGSGPAQ